jgi:uncharacterized membrane protein YfcA
MFGIEIAAYALLGIVAGLLSGLLGIGGGVVTVPCLVLIFGLLKFPPDSIMHMAIGTSLAAMVFNTISSTWAHNRRGAVLWDVVIRMMPGIVVGSILGALVAHLLSGDILEIAFGLFAICLGIYLLRPYHLHEGDHRLPGTVALSGVGCGLGWISNILGIGGGIITVPILVAYRVPEKKAIATSAATSFSISLLGALSYLYFGLKHASVKESIGYLYLPAFIVISIATFLAAPYGAKLTHILSPPLLRRIFAGALILTGLVMVLT